MGHLDDRVVVVTGAGRGIGAAVARATAAQGARVVVADLGVDLDGTGRDPGLANDVVGEITATGGTAAACVVDVSDHRSADELVQFAVDTYGGLDVLVNAAGILRDRMVFNMSEEEWDAVIAVHLKGTFNTSKFASIHWRKEREGDYRLINFTSIAGLYGSPSQPNYAAAKMGIVGLTLSCANALGQYGVTANCISPGATTRMTDTLPTEQRSQFPDSFGDPSEDEARAPERITPAIVYLASKDSGWLTGRVIGAQRFRISLWSNPKIQRQLMSTGRWSLDDVFTEMPRAFQPMTEGRRRLDEAG